MKITLLVALTLCFVQTSWANGSEVKIRKVMELRRNMLSAEVVPVPESGCFIVQGEDWNHQEYFGVYEFANGSELYTSKSGQGFGFGLSADCKTLYRAGKNFEIVDLVTKQSTFIDMGDGYHSILRMHKGNLLVRKVCVMGDPDSCTEQLKLLDIRNKSWKHISRNFDRMNQPQYVFTVLPNSNRVFVMDERTGRGYLFSLEDLSLVKELRFGNYLDDDVNTSGRVTISDSSSLIALRNNNHVTILNLTDLSKVTDLSLAAQPYAVALDGKSFMFSMSGSTQIVSLHDGQTKRSLMFSSPLNVLFSNHYYLQFRYDGDLSNYFEVGSLMDEYDRWRIVNLNRPSIYHLDQKTMMIADEAYNRLNIYIVQDTRN